jgi:hydrogenase nickel incorporation protein HypB
MHEITVNASLLQANDAVALENREIFTSHGIYVFNLMSGPGAGKTTLLEKTLAALAGRYRFAVIEGDVQSDADARRIQRCGIPAVQVNTGGACHLDARQVHNALGRFDLHHLEVLVIENVGNLVCPAEFDLGEHDKVMLLSVAEGEDKPRKYPVMFHVARAVLISKVDLLPHVDFDAGRAERDIAALNLDAPVFRLSARTGEGMDRWLAWLEERILRVRQAAPGERR